MELQHIIEEFITTVKSPRYDDPETFDIFVNPNYAEVKDAIDNSPSTETEFFDLPTDKALRACIINGDLYIWGAMNEVHMAIYNVLYKQGIDTDSERESIIPLWLYLDDDYKVCEVRLSPTVDDTVYNKYMTKSGTKVTSEIFKFIKTNPYLRAICSPTVKWSTVIGD